MYVSSETIFKFCILHKNILNIRYFVSLKTNIRRIICIIVIKEPKSTMKFCQDHHMLPSVVQFMDEL